LLASRELLEAAYCQSMRPTSPEALAEAFGAAINARDVPAALELWIEDAAIVQPDGQMLRGREAVGDALRALVENDVSVEIDVARVFAAADVAIAVGTLTLSGAGADGRPFRQQSRSVVIYARDAQGGWRVAIDAPWGLPSA
jgi:uncharacterized protein (TIGR02246 family)